MKKKTVSLILAMMLLVTALSGCGGTGSSSKPENNATEADADAGEKTESAESVQESAEPVQEATEPAQEASEPAGEGTKEDVQFAGGSGTAEDPWQIATAEQLDRVRDDLKAHYILTEDIDLSGYENWIPIGAFQSLSDAPEDAEVPHPDYAFTGTFDGAGHTISNLKVSCEAPMGAGLFGCASGTESGAASIGHFTLKNVNVSGFYLVGGLVGFGGSYDPTAPAQISGCTVEDVSIVVSETTDSVGGLIGAGKEMMEGSDVMSSFVISGCSVSGTIEGGGNNVGEVVGDPACAVSVDCEGGMTVSAALDTAA